MTCEGCPTRVAMETIVTPLLSYLSFFSVFPERWAEDMIARKMSKKAWTGRPVCDIFPITVLSPKHPHTHTHTHTQIWTRNTYMHVLLCHIPKLLCVPWTFVCLCTSWGNHWVFFHGLFVRVWLFECLCFSVCEWVGACVCDVLVLLVDRERTQECISVRFHAE